MSALLSRESAKDIRRGIAVAADSDAKPIKVEISSEGRDNASYAIVAVGGAAKLDGEGHGFVLERVVDHDHRTGNFGGVTERGGDCWSSDVHEGLWRVRLSPGDSGVWRGDVLGLKSVRSTFESPRTTCERPVKPLRALFGDIRMPKREARASTMRCPTLYSESVSDDEVSDGTNLCRVFGNGILPRPTTSSWGIPGETVMEPD